MIPPEEAMIAEIYSNFDHTFDESVAADLEASPGTVAAHSAWDFHGKVHFRDGKWYERIFVYGSQVAVIEGSSAREVIEQAIARYGAK